MLPSSYFDNIVRYVREGGALLIAAGPEFASAASLARTRLAAILPASRTAGGRAAYKAALTNSGQRHPVTRDLPGSEASPPAWGDWLRLIGAEVRPGVTPIMAGPIRCRCWRSPARRRAGSRSSSPTMPGSGPAATRRAVRISTCCAASATG